MANETIQVGDEGTVFEFPITDEGGVLSLANAVVLQVKFRKPKAGLLEAETVIKTAILVTNGTDGKIKYTTIAGDIDRAGRWSVQAYIELPDWKGHSEVKIFQVKDNL